MVQHGRNEELWNSPVECGSARSSTSLELRADRKQDGTLDPGGQVSVSGQSGDLNYLFSFEAEPNYRNSKAREFSFDPDGNLTETRR